MSSPKNSIKILAISGSVRINSTNTKILRAISRLSSGDAIFTFYEGLETIPAFNPEIADENTPETVKHFRKLIAEANAVIICTPEYAFGVPGVLKNALDWTVSSGEFNEKSIAAITATPGYMGGENAMAALLPTLRAIGTKMSENGKLSIGTVKQKINDAGEITDTNLSNSLKLLLEELVLESLALH